MKTFENFIESEAFFPVLILLLVMLIGVFIWIMLSNKKIEKQRREKKHNIKIDENSEIKIVADSPGQKRPVIIEEEEEPARTEIAIVEEVNVNQKRTIFDYEADLNPKKAEEYPEEEHYNSEVGLVVTNEIHNEKESVNVLKNIEDNQDINLSSFTTDEPEIPNADNYQNDELAFSNSAFEQQPNEDHFINEDIKVELPQEYTSEKTEIFDFPSFDENTEVNDSDIEEAVIASANEYIRNIMSKKD